MNRFVVVWLLMHLGLCPQLLRAQPAPFDESQSARAGQALLGITILGNPAFSLSSVNDYTNGRSITHNTLQLSVSIGVSWSLQVRVTDDLRYQMYAIPASSIAVQSLGLGNRPEIFLSTSNQTLASGLATSLLNSALPIRYRALGGPAFLKPAGSYTTTLLFSFTAL